LNADLLLRIEVLRRAPSLASDRQVRSAAELLPVPLGPSMQHDAPVRGVALSNDGRLVLTMPDGNTVVVWDATGANALLHLDHGARLNGFAISPDSRLVATAGVDGKVRLWKSADGTSVLTVAHDEAVNGVAFAPDGRSFATASDDHTVRLWDTALGNEIERLRHNACVFAVAFNTKGDVLATRGDDGVRLWRMPSAVQLGLVRDDDGPIESIQFAGLLLPALVTASVGGNLRLWDSENGRPAESPAGPGSGLSVRLSRKSATMRIPFSQSRARIVGDDFLVAFGNGNTAHLEYGGQELLRVVHDGTVTSADIRVQNETMTADLVTGSEDRTARLWRYREDERILAQPVEGAAVIVALSEDSRWAVGRSRSGLLTISEAPFTSARPLPGSEFGSPLRFSRDGTLLATRRGPEIDTFDLRTGSQLSRIPLPENAPASLDLVRPIRSGPFLFALVGNSVFLEKESCIEIWDPATGKKVWDVPKPAGTRSVQVSGNGASFAVQSDSGLSVWHHAGRWSEHRVAEVKVDAGTIAFSPDSRLLAVCTSTPPELQLFSSDTGRKAGSLPLDTPCTYVAFDSRGSRVAVGRGVVAGDTQVWRLSGAKRLQTLTGYGRAAFSPDGRHIALQEEQNLRIWDVDAGEIVAEFGAPGAQPAFTTDGRLLFDGRQLRYWRPEDVIREACRHAARPLTQKEWKLHFPDEPYSTICPELRPVR
jgi:WD40 repeat protein